MASSLTKKKIVTLLEPKRVRNVGIAIARFKLDPVKIKRELLAMSFAPKDRERLELLITHAPTGDEEELLQQHEATPNLGKVERFFVDVLAIPGYRDRVESALFKVPRRAAPRHARRPPVALAMLSRYVLACMRVLAVASFGWI